jgi:hypothetical protein
MISTIACSAVRRIRELNVAIGARNAAGSRRY